MLQYLGIIEQKTSEVLQAYAATQLSITPLNEQSSKELHLTVVQPKGPIYEDIMKEYEEMISGETQMHFTALGDKVPVIDEHANEADSNSEDDERPLTRQELDKKTFREFSKKTGGGAVVGGPQGGGK